MRFTHMIIPFTVGFPTRYNYPGENPTSVLSLCTATGHGALTVWTVTSCDNKGRRRHMDKRDVDASRRPGAPDCCIVWPSAACASKVHMLQVMSVACGNTRTWSVVIAH